MIDPLQFYLPILLMSIIISVMLFTFIVSYRYDRSTKRFEVMKYISDKVRYDLR